MDNKIIKYKTIAFSGVFLMGIGSFLSCLAPSKFLSGIGTVLLLLSLIISSYGFTYWQP